MTSKIEEIAFAMFQDTVKDGSQWQWDHAGDGQREIYISNARAAIKALKDESDKAVWLHEVGRGKLGEMPNPVSFAAARQCFNAMLQAILDEESETV